MEIVCEYFSFIFRLKRAEIIPTGRRCSSLSKQHLIAYLVIDDFLPSLMLGIEWHKEEADLGNTIKPKKVQKAPTIELRDDISSCANYACASNMTYTIVLTDPDAPSRDNPEWSEVCHWIATGVPITSASGRCREGDIVKASKRKIKEVMPYKPPGPPPKTGKHRYVFLAFVPLNGTSIPLNLSKPSTRKHWGTGKERHGVRQWAAENKLTPIGTFDNPSRLMQNFPR